MSMDTIEAGRVGASGQAAAKRNLTQGVTAGDWAPNVQAPARVVDGATGETILIAARYPDGERADARRAVMGYPMSTTRRSAGIRNRSAVFGNVSRRVHMKREGCRSCGGAHEAPGAHAGILRAGTAIKGLLGDLEPDRMRADMMRARETIRSEWMIGGTPWTSGVLNETSPLPYHRDANNLPCWSAMLVLRRGVTGGHLHLPEYNLVVECRDGDVIWFPGYDLIHGVTPMDRRTRDAYRYTAVFYTVAGMAHCLEPREEMARAQRARSEREDGLLDRQAAEGMRA
jgi:hypothetical protein